MSIANISWEIILNVQYVKNKALFETWKYSLRKYSIIILWGIKIYVKLNQNIEKVALCYV